MAKGSKRTQSSNLPRPTTFSDLHRTQRHGPSWLLRNARTFIRTILVAPHGARHLLVYPNLSYVSNQENTTSAHSPDCRDASTPILKGIHGYDAHAELGRIQIHCSRSMFANSLARVGNAAIRERKDTSSMDSTRHHLLMGLITRDRY